MRYFGNIQVEGDRTVIGLNSKPSQINPYSGWVTYDMVGENVYTGAGLYFNMNSKTWKLALSNNINMLPCRGIALQDSLSGSDCPILRFGIMYAGRWNFLSSMLYLSDTSPGTITTTIPTNINSYVQCVGTAKDRRIGIFDFSPTLVKIG